MKLPERYTESISTVSVFFFFLCISKVTFQKMFLKNSNKKVAFSDMLKRGAFHLLFPSAFHCCYAVTLRSNLMNIVLLEEGNARWSQMKCSPDCTINMAPMVNYLYVGKKNIQNKRTRPQWDQIWKKNYTIWLCYALV